MVKTPCMFCVIAGMLTVSCWEKLHGSLHTVAQSCFGRNQPHVITGKHSRLQLERSQSITVLNSNSFPSQTKWKTSRKKAKITTIMCHWWAGEFKGSIIILVPVAVRNLWEKSWWWCVSPKILLERNREKETQPSSINAGSSRTSLLTQNVRSTQAH